MQIEIWPRPTQSTQPMADQSTEQRPIAPANAPRPDDPATAFAAWMAKNGHKLQFRRAYLSAIGDRKSPGHIGVGPPFPGKDCGPFLRTLLIMSLILVEALPDIVVREWFNAKQYLQYMEGAWCYIYASDSS